MLGGAAPCRSSEAAPPGPGAADSTPSAAPSPAPTAAPTENLPAVATTAVASSAVTPDAGADDAGADDAGADAEQGDASATQSAADAGAQPECPPEMARMGRYCVDRWEAHLVALGPDGVDTPWTHVDRPDQGLRYAARSGPGFFPQAYISRTESSKACEMAGKRLCSRSEWMRACRGKRGSRYPYGDKGQRGACNNGKPHLMSRFFGDNPRRWSYEGFNDKRLDLEPDFLAKTGSYEACHTDESVYDMVGNLHEWVSDTIGPDIEQVLERDQVDRNKQPWAVGNGIFMGGFFSTTVEHGPGCAFTTIAHEPDYHDYSTGFRCCMDVPGLEKRPGLAGKKRKR